MYALIKVAGRQYRVSQNEQLKVDRLQSDPGDEVVILDVMMVARDSDVEIGAPYLPYRVTMETVEHGRHPKVMSYRFKRRGGARKMHGHRQQYTLVRVKAIEPQAITESEG